jgi:hypothetical protein
MTPSTLTNLIADHRQLFELDLRIPEMVTRHPPVTLDLHTGIPEEEPAAAVGMNVSARLLRLIGHPDGYGHHHPWRTALWRLRYDCRRRHPEHTAEEPWRGSLCHRLIRLVIEYERPLPDAADELGIDRAKAAGLLRAGLIWIEGSIDRARDDAERRETLVDHRLKGLHLSKPAA